MKISRWRNTKKQHLKKRKINSESLVLKALPSVGLTLNKYAVGRSYKSTEKKIESRFATKMLLYY